MHVFSLVSILAAISYVLANPPHGSEQSAKVVARETSLKLLSMGNKAFRDNEKVANEWIVELRTKNINRTDMEEPKINEPGYCALVEENVKASVRCIVTNPVINPSFVPPDMLVACLKRSVIHNNDEPLSLTSSAAPYPPGQRGYRVHSITANRFFTYGNVIFENMAYNFIPSIPASTHDYSTLPFLDQSDSVFPAVPELPINPANLDNLDMTPTLQPPHLDAELLHRTRSRDGSRGRNFEKKIEVGKARLERILEAAARRGGEGDDNPFVALCDSGILDESRADSAVMAASLDADDYLQHDIGSRRGDIRRNLYAGGYDMSIAPATYSEAERRMDVAQWQKLTEREVGDGKRMRVYEDVDKLVEGKKPIGCRIYKARLMTRGFSRVPFVDYRAHHPPPLSPGLWRLHLVVTPLDRGYTNNDTLPEWGIQASYLGCLPAAGVLIALTANLKARYRAKRHIYTNPNTNLNTNLNANPNANS